MSWKGRYTLSICILIWKIIRFLKSYWLSKPEYKECKSKSFITTKLRLSYIFLWNHTLLFLSSRVHFFFICFYLPISLISFPHWPMETAFSAKLPFCTNREVLLQKIHRWKQLFLCCGSGRLSSAPQLLEHPQEIPIVFTDGWKAAEICQLMYILELGDISHWSDAMPLFAYLCTMW